MNDINKLFGTPMKPTPESIKACEEFRKNMKEGADEHFRNSKPGRGLIVETSNCCGKPLGYRTGGLNSSYCSGCGKTYSELTF